MRSPSFVRLVPFALVTLAACGGETREPAVPENAAPAEASPQKAPRRSGLSVETELGQIDPKATEATFQALSQPLSQCFHKGLGRVDYLGGDVAFFLRVGEGGKAKFAYLEQSSLGDRDTERCMLDAALHARWPTPQGGDAEVRKTLGFDPPGDVRAPVSWSSDKLADALGKSGPKLDACKAGTAGKFNVTMYVEPDGKGGRPQAVGVAPPSREGEGQVDCLVDALKGMKLPSPGSYAAKVSFAL